MENFFTVKQISEKYGKSEETIKRWLRKGNKFPNAIKHSDKEGWKIPISDVEYAENTENKTLIRENSETFIGEDLNTRTLVATVYQIATMTYPSEELINILSFVGLKRTLELLLVLRQSPSKVKNPTAFLKKAITEGWTPQTIPQRVERQKPFSKPCRKEIVPTWLNQSEAAQKDVATKEDSTEELLERYDLLKSFYEMGNESAKDQLQLLQKVLEKRGISF